MDILEDCVSEAMVDSLENWYYTFIRKSADIVESPCPYNLQPSSRDMIKRDIDIRIVHKKGCPVRISTSPILCNTIDFKFQSIDLRE